MGAGTWDAGRALVHETLREAHSCCHRAVGTAATLACLYPRPTQAMGTAAALACSYPRLTRAMGMAAALACSYPRPTQVMGMAIAFAFLCPRPTQVMGTAATLACSYPPPGASHGYSSDFGLLIPSPGASHGYSGDFGLLIPSPGASHGYSSRNSIKKGSTMDQISIFDYQNEQNVPASAPLADRMRPTGLEDYVGQKHLLGKGMLLRRMLEQDQISSMIFWGPPGVGKTTLARIIANRTRSGFVNFSAVTSGIREIKEIMRQAEENRAYGMRTLCFVDEIHRFNKAQQDAFLPYVEKGSITLIGATTENPSFEINAALLSRCKVFVLKELTADDLTELLTRALTDKRGFGSMDVHMDQELIAAVASFANGDARTALNTLEMAVLNGEIAPDGSITVKKEALEQCLGKKTLLYDKKGEEHYNLISALHKSMRNSDPDAAVYWLARMLEAGEDPLFIARRLIRFASEDIGLADNQALQIAVSAYQACHFNGMPECNVNLAQAVIYLSLAPRSNAAYRAYEAARADALTRLSEPVPLVIRNAPTRLMDELHYGEGYVYAHDTEEKIAHMTCLPDGLKDRKYYQPGTQGEEKIWKERLEKSRAFRE